MTDIDIESPGADAADLSHAMRRLSRRLISAGDWSDGILNHATSTYQFMGYDAVDDRVFINDSTGGLIRQGTTADAWATQGGATFSTSKGLPTNVTYANAKKIIRFGAKLYLLALDTSDSKWKVWSCDPAAGNTAFTWSSPLTAMLTTVANGSQPTVFSADASYLYLGEYGDPTGGPTAWRSADGTTWTQMYTEIGQGSPMRHIHAIAPDPYNPGHVWMTLGDGGARTILKSTDYGATWNTIVVSSIWQGVQISFSANYVWIAGDSQRGHVIAIDRATGTPYHAARGQIKNVAVPVSGIVNEFIGSATYDPPSLVDGAGATTTVTVTGAALGDIAEAAFSLDTQGITITAWVSATNTVSVRFQNESGGTLDLASGTLRARTQKASALSAAKQFYANGYVGCVDPATEVFYFVANDTSASGNTFGLFSLLEMGDDPVLVDIPTQVSGPVEIAAGFLWHGKARRKLWTLSRPPY